MRSWGSAWLAGRPPARLRTSERAVRVSRSRIADQAYDDVHRYWSWPVVAGRITDVYADLLARDVKVPEIPDPPRDPSCRFRAAPHLL